MLWERKRKWVYDERKENIKRSLKTKIPAFCLWRESRVRTAAAGVMAGQAFRKFLPLFDRVLVERSAAETVTKGGIMLPEKSQGKVL